MKILTGFRRSGSSMIMFALKMAGLRIAGNKWAGFNKRTAKHANPNGYWEVENTTARMGLGEKVEGDVIKVMFDCLYMSDTKLTDKVLVIMRKPQSILESIFKYNEIKHKRMFVMNYCLDAIDSFGFIQYAKKPYKIVFYEDILEKPEDEMNKICRFMGGNYKQAAQVIDGKLNRCTGNKKYEGIGIEFLEEIHKLARIDNIEEIMELKPQVVKIAKQELKKHGNKNNKTQEA